MQTENDDDLYGGQRSSDTCIKCGKQYDYHIWSKEPLMQAKRDDDLHGGRGHQRSNMVSYVPWLPYLVKRIADAN